MKVSTKKKRTSTVALIALLELKVDDLRRRIVFLEDRMGVGWTHEFKPAVHYEDDYYWNDPKSKMKRGENNVGDNTVGINVV